jgi:hypothetical protein
MIYDHWEMMTDRMVSADHLSGHLLSGVLLSGVLHISTHGWVIPGSARHGLVAVFPAAAIPAVASPVAVFPAAAILAVVFPAEKMPFTPMKMTKESDHFSVSAGLHSLLGHYCSPSCLDFPSSGGETADPNLIEQPGKCQAVFLFCPLA